MDVPNSGGIVTKDVSGVGPIALERFITGSHSRFELWDIRYLAAVSKQIRQDMCGSIKKIMYKAVVRYGMHSCTKLKTGGKEMDLSADNVRLSVRMNEWKD